MESDRQQAASLHCVKPAEEPSYIERLHSTALKTQSRCHYQQQSRHHRHHHEYHCHHYSHHRQRRNHRRRRHHPSLGSGFATLPPPSEWDPSKATRRPSQMDMSIWQVALWKSSRISHSTVFENHTAVGFWSWRLNIANFDSLFSLKISLGSEVAGLPPPSEWDPGNATQRPSPMDNREASHTQNCL